MPRWQRVYVVACAFVIAYSIMYAVVDYAHLPRLTYFQLEHEWRFVSRPGGPLPSGYVGMWVWALVAGLVAGAAAWGVTWRSRGGLSERALGLGLAWTMTAVGVVGAYFTWNNWP